jgi:hypothetical protein
MTRAETHEALHASMPAPYADAIESFFADHTVDETTVNNTVESVTNHPARSLDTWVRENLHLFQ